MKPCARLPTSQQVRGNKCTSKIIEGAIIGFGKMAEHGHLPGWQRNRAIRIKAVVDPRHERRARAQELLVDVHTYPQLEDLLENERLDFVDISTPPPYHASLIIQCLKQNLHVLCEKPFVSTMRDLRRVKALVTRGQKTAFPVHNWKYAPILVKAKERITGGAIGELIHSEFHTLRVQPAEGLTSWRDKAEESGGGGILMDHGWHGLYILCNLSQQRPVAVTSWMRPSNDLGVAERSVHLFLEFQTSMASLFLTWEAPRRYNSARIYGTRGIICIEDDVFSLTTRKGNQETITFHSPLSYGSHHPEWFDAVIQEFLHEIACPDQRGKALEEVYTCLQLTLMAYASAGNGSKRIQLSRGLRNAPLSEAVEKCPGARRGQISPLRRMKSRRARRT